MPKMYLFNTCATVSHGICLPLGMRLGISTLSICIPVFFGYYGLWWIYVEYSWSWAGKIGALSIQPNRSKMWKQRQMAQKFPWKVSRNSGNCWISECEPFKRKILEIPGDQLNGKTTSGKKISTIWVYLARLSPFWKFLKMLFHSLLKVVENLIGSFGGMESWFLHLVTLVDRCH